jgi:hypothetical protein
VFHLPAGRKYLLDAWEGLLGEYRSVGPTSPVYWPYDEGGCGCPQCWPWGSRGYVQICRDFTRLARSKTPHFKSVDRALMFDKPPAGEWTGLTKGSGRGQELATNIMPAREDSRVIRSTASCPAACRW